jgi:hypothetical protein
MNYNLTQDEPRCQDAYVSTCPDINSNLRSATAPIDSHNQLHEDYHLGDPLDLLKRR